MALWFLRLPTDRLQRRERARQPSISQTPPLVIVSKVDNALRLSSVDRKATALGLHIGQPLANARAMVPEIRIVSANDPADSKFLTHIADWCDRFTPFVALDGPRRLLLDVTGVAHLFGGEQALLDRIQKNLKAQGFALRGAVAGTAVAARALARYRDGIVIASGEEECAMKPLPIEALDLDGLTNHALRRAGLKTVGQVAARKRSELVVRLGTVPLAILEEALGGAAKPITPRQPPPDYWQEQNFAEPIATEDLIRATLKSLGVSLAKTLERDGQGARRLEAVFFRADGAVRRIAIEMARPTRDPLIIMRLFHEKLAAIADPLDPGFGFDLIRLCASHVERVASEGADLNSSLHEAVEISFLVDRLAARFGNHRILAFHPHETHIPEEAWVTIPAQRAEPPTSSWKKSRQAGDAPRRPLRLFAVSEPMDFSSAPFLTWRKMQRIVSQQEGPERIAMQWWRPEMPQAARDYFRVEDNEGKRYWLYRKDATAQWFLHGVFA